MKIKPRTKAAFEKWCETHKMSDTFILAGEPMKGSAVHKIIYGEAPKTAPKPPEPVNTDIQEESDADMGEPLHTGDTEEH